MLKPNFLITFLLVSTASMVNLPPTVKQRISLKRFLDFFSFFFVFFWWRIQVWGRVYIWCHRYYQMSIQNYPPACISSILTPTTVPELTYFLVGHPLCGWEWPKLSLVPSSYTLGLRRGSTVSQWGASLHQSSRFPWFVWSFMFYNWLHGFPPTIQGVSLARTQCSWNRLRIHCKAD